MFFPHSTGTYNRNILEVGLYESDNTIGLTRTDKIDLKNDCVEGSILKGLNNVFCVSYTLEV